MPRTKLLLTLIAAVLVLAAVPAGSSEGAAPAKSSPPSGSPRSARPAVAVPAAISLCRAHPASTYTLSVRGYYIGGATGYGFVQGGLAASSAVARTLPANWDLHGAWKRYGIILVQILELHPDQQAIRGRLTVHGTLTCRTLILRSESDPFPPSPATLTPTPTPIPNGTVHNVLSVAEARALCSAHAGKYLRIIVMGYVESVVTPPAILGALFDHPVKPFSEGDTDQLAAAIKSQHGISMGLNFSVQFFPWDSTWIVIHGMLHCGKPPAIVGDSWHLTDPPPPAPGGHPLPTMTPTPTYTPTPVPNVTATPLVQRASSKGFSLMASIPGGEYPRKALVPVTLTLANGSSHNARLDPPCEELNPVSFVYGLTNAENYNPPIPHPDCLPAHRSLFKRGAFVTRRVLVILNGGRVGSGARIWTPASAFWPQYVELRTQPLLVRLDPGSAPALALVTHPSVHADLTPPGPDAGPLYYMDSYLCPNNRSGGHAAWTSTTGTRLQPGCPHPLEWRAVAGWIGHPVLYIDY